VSTGITQPLSLIPAHAPDLNPLASFGPMWVPRAASLYRLLRTPAGCRPFPTLSPQSLYGCLVPCPVAPPRCTYSFLPVGQRPHLKNQRFGAQNHRHNATSAAGLFRGCSSRKETPLGLGSGLFSPYPPGFPAVPQYSSHTKGRTPTPHRTGQAAFPHPAPRYAIQ
jgi:hypothetical protein